MTTFSTLRIVALAGGVGGAKLAHGLAQCLPPENLTVIVNTGDDFVHWGLNISPDLDTVCYTLSGLANPLTGWGRQEESWHVFESMQANGAPDWFRLGDKDLATHLIRTESLRHGDTLTDITKDLCTAWGVRATVLPMTDTPMPTLVMTTQGWLGFQEYFVHQRCEPEVSGFKFENAAAARPAPGVLERIAAADAVIFCPSNPWVSIDPILSVPGMRPALRKKLSVAVSPIIAGQTVKGPAAKMFRELGVEPSAQAVAIHYGELVKGFVIDTQDAEQRSAVEALGMIPLITDTLMKDALDRARLATDVLHFVQRLMTA